MEILNNITTYIKNRASLFVTLILIAIVISTAFIPAKWFGITPKVYRETPLDLGSPVALDSIAKDTNKDGVITWDEIIKQTVDASTTNSLKNEKVDQTAIDNLNDPNNLTSDFSKNLFLTTAYIKNNNITIDDASKEKMISDLVAGEADKLTKTVYGLSDIKISQSEDKDSIKKYGNAIGLIIYDIVTFKKIAEDITSITGYLKTKDIKYLTAIKNKRSEIDLLLQKFLNTPVPMSAIPYHLLAINRIADYRDTLNDLSKADTDPIRTKLALERYTKVVWLVIKIPRDLFEYFDIKNVVFKGEDTGYMFTVGYNINK